MRSYLEEIVKTPAEKIKKSAIRTYGGNEMFLHHS
jgi:hypothetical protein